MRNARGWASTREASFNSPEFEGEARLELAQKIVLVERQHHLGVRVAFVPHEAAKAAGHGQDGERPAREEVLFGAALVVALVGNGRHDAGLPGIAPDGGDPASPRSFDRAPSAATMSRAFSCRPSVNASAAVVTPGSNPLTARAQKFDAEGVARAGSTRLRGRR